MKIERDRVRFTGGLRCAGDDGYGRQGGGYQGRPRSGGSSGPRRAYREDEDDGGTDSET